MNLENQKVIAFVMSVKTTSSGHQDVTGWALFSTVELLNEFSLAGHCLEDFLCGLSSLPVGACGLFTWEGSVVYSEDDAEAYGKWRRSNAREIIDVSSGKNPFASVASVECP